MPHDTIDHSPRPRSESAFEHAQAVLPGGVNSPARAFGAVGGKPVYFERGEGAYLYDLDGQKYLDFVGSWGPLILGHAHPQVVAALHAAVDQGTSFGAPTVRETEIAELIVSAVPSMDMVRLVNSGTEATMSAIRLARGATGREKIIKFAGNYHGHVDSLLVSAGSSAATLGVPNSPGVTTGTAGDTLVLPYNDPQTLASAFATHPQEFAAVIFEPIVGNMGVVVPSREFLQTLRDVTSEAGTLLICDEVMTGFRVAFGGAQELFDIEPDLTTLGKIVGGGLPVGAYGGKRKWMQQVLPAGQVFQAGTLSGNPLATAAGLATLQQLRDDPPYERLERLAAMWEQGVYEAAGQANVPLQVGRVGSMVTFFFVEQPVTDWESASKCDTQRFANFFWAMLEQGFYVPPSQFEAMFISAAHTEKDIQNAIEAARHAMGKVSA